MSNLDIISRNPCPVSNSDIDIVPECYHNIGRCLCFSCTCGSHKCPSQTPHCYSKSIYKSSYKRSYSRPIQSAAPKRIQAEYHPNSNKMDLISSYMREFVPLPTNKTESVRPKTPQPSYKFEATTQYAQDFPDWGPVDYYHNKKIQHPVYETCLKFQGKSSYQTFFAEKSKKSEGFKLQHPEEFKTVDFQMPYQTTNNREYKLNPTEYFVKAKRQKSDGGQQVFYNPHAFKTSMSIDFCPRKVHCKSPAVYRNEMITKDLESKRKVNK